jgi:hypothetical protein
MGNVPIADKVTGDNYTATEFNQMKNDGINDNDARITALEGASTVQVSDVSDLPAPVSDVITLADSTIYVFNGSVNIGVNRLVMGADTLITGHYAEIDGIISTTAGAIINASDSFKLQEIKITATSSTGFALTGTNTENALFARVTMIVGSLGTCADYSVFDINQANFISLGAGLTISGAMLAISLQGGAFYNESGVGLDLNGLTADIIQISRMYFNNNNSSTGINVAASGANLNADSIGVITFCSFLDVANAVTGYSPLDLKWSVDLNQNNSIIPSDRFLPTGWGTYVDAETTPATQTFNTTPAKLQIDAAGGTTNENYLPKSIRGTASLWDSVNDKITPITEGDSYDIRINIEVTSKTSNPNVLTAELDIGGGGSPTTVIVRDDKSVTAAPPYSLIYTFPIFDLTTFFTNGGQLFLSTDVGSLTVGARSITIFRTSSGAS